MTHASPFARRSATSPVAADLAKWLGLAASPTFGIMALLTTLAGDGSVPLLCSSGRGFAPGGMVPMYVLMALFHSPPWLKLVAGLKGPLPAIRP